MDTDSPTRLARCNQLMIATKERKERREAMSSPCVLCVPSRPILCQQSKDLCGCITDPVGLRCRAASRPRTASGPRSQRSAIPDDAGQLEYRLYLPPAADEGPSALRNFDGSAILRKPLAWSPGFSRDSELAAVSFANYLWQACKPIRVKTQGCPSAGLRSPPPNRIAVNSLVSSSSNPDSWIPRAISGMWAAPQGMIRTSAFGSHASISPNR